MHEETTDFLCQHQQWENEIPYRNIHFCSTFDSKPFRVTQGLDNIDASISYSSIIKKKNKTKQNKTKTKQKQRNKQSKTKIKNKTKNKNKLTKTKQNMSQKLFFKKVSIILRESIKHANF